MQTIVLPDECADIGPVPAEEAVGQSEPELDRLWNIIAAFTLGSKVIDVDIERLDHCRRGRLLPVLLPLVPRWVAVGNQPG